MEREASRPKPIPVRSPQHQWRHALSAMFASLAPLRDRPVPDLSAARQRKHGYRELPIDSSDARASDPLLPLADLGVNGRSYYAQDRNPPYWARVEGAAQTLYARAGVGDLLMAVNGRLAPAGLRLHVYDAWRPRAVQAYFYEVWVPDELRKRRPHLDAQALQAEVNRYWAKPTDDPRSPAPHSTGSAIDLTLVWDDGEPLFMGSIFDDASAISATDHFEKLADLDWSFSAEEARASRRLLYWVMTEAGFANHPDEWWHYSWGDQMWARLTGQPAAIYGLAAPPTDVT
jgi:zinc D-Ala-D-Ala dipeptidase